MVSISRQYPLVTAKNKSSIWYKIIVFRNMLLSFSPLPERSQCIKLHSGYKTMSLSENVAPLHNAYTYFFSSCLWNASVAAACWGKETVYQLSTKGKKQTHKKYSSSWVSLPSFFSTLWNSLLIIDLIPCFLSVRSPHLDVSLGDALAVSPLTVESHFPCQFVEAVASQLSCGPTSSPAFSPFYLLHYQLLLTQECTRTARLQGLSLLLLLPPLLKPSAETNANRVRATRTVLRCETKDVDKVCCSLLPFVFASNLTLLFCVCRGGARFLACEALTLGRLMKGWHSGMSLAQHKAYSVQHEKN